ncbi:helix-turn-helix transcriptional regulator [Endozoicomonas lisbonensis]|uniref:Transcriptional regulator with XRE-family HTH domain n=1 Tax=Endozoicomonas lisbonensis TaxID=3120522 RepID=A0ABV2SGZ5_9GAMM
MESIGQTFKTRRKAKGWNQTQLAKRAGTTRSVVSAIENDRYRGALWALVNCLGLLGLELSVKEARRPTWYELDELFGDDE